MDQNFLQIESFLEMIKDEHDVMFLYDQIQRFDSHTLSVLLEHIQRHPSLQISHEVFEFIKLQNLKKRIDEKNFFISNTFSDLMYQIQDIVFQQKPYSLDINCQIELEKLAQEIKFFLREDLDSSFNYKILNEFLAEKFSINLLADNFLEYDLHYVLFTKTTNLYFLTLIYLMVAEKLNLPIYGLPLKEKIVLLYCHTHCGHAEMVYEDCIDFYFTPGIYGSVYTLDDLKMFALANNKEITLEETLPKDNSAIINHWLRMMSKSLSLLSSDSKLYISYQQNINSLINR